MSAPAPASAARDPTEIQELTRLISTSNNTSIYPTDDSILSLLHARFRHDQPYTRLAPSSSTLVVVNPVKHMRNLDDESQREYKARCYDADSTDNPGRRPPLQPHPYQLAANIYSFMRRRNQSQAVVFRSVPVPSCIAIAIATASLWCYCTLTFTLLVSSSSDDTNE